MTMTGLFDPARHEPLQAAPWDEGAARVAIACIVDAALAEYRPGEGWAAHPLDDPEAPGHCDAPVYHGAAGVVLALRHLARAGAIGAGQALPEFGPLLARLRDVHHAGLADARHGSASFLIGDVGMELLLWTLQPGEALAQRLHQAISGNLHNPVRESLWGNAGTVLAAICLAEACGETACEARWVALVRQAADALESELQVDPDTGTWVWVQDLYGRPGERMLGAGHGFAGNVYSFLRGATARPAARWPCTSCGSAPAMRSGNPVPARWRCACRGPGRAAARAAWPGPAFAVDRRPGRGLRAAGLPAGRVGR
jgi:hypothetical protein